MASKGAASVTKAAVAVSGAASKIVASSSKPTAASATVGGVMGLDAAGAARLNLAAMKEAAAIMSLRMAPLSLDDKTGRLRPLGFAPPQVNIGPPTLRKRLRLHPHWKLRPARRWVDFVPFISLLTITFDPALYGSAGARELARQAQGSTVKTKFSKCDIKVTETEDGEPGVVQVKWVSYLIFL